MLVMCLEFFGRLHGTAVGATSGILTDSVVGLFRILTCSRQYLETPSLLPSCSGSRSVIAWNPESAQLLSSGTQMMSKSRERTETATWYP